MTDANALYGVYFPGIPSIRNTLERVDQAIADTVLFETQLGLQFARRAVAVLEHRLNKAISVTDLANPVRVAKLNPDEVDPYEHVRHLTRNVISYNQIYQAITSHFSSSNFTPVLLCGRSMGILSAMVVSGCIPFEDGIYIAANMAQFHTESYQMNSEKYLSRKLYCLSDIKFELLMAKFYHYGVRSPLFILEHDPTRYTLIQYSEKNHVYLEECLQQLQVSSSAFSHFPSGAHTPMTSSRICNLRRILEHEVRIKAPDSAALIHSQAYKQPRQLLTTSEDLCTELVEVMNGAMNLIPLYQLLTDLSQREKCFLVIEVGSKDLAIALSQQHPRPRKDLVQFHSPFTPSFAWLDRFIVCRHEVHKS